MKKAAMILSGVLACSVAIAAPAGAQCPEGKQAMTIYMEKSGKTKVLCVSDNAAAGIENAADNSATTIVPAACPKECWTATDVEYWGTKGQLECSWKDVVLHCVSSAATEEVFQLAVMQTEGYSLCIAIDTGAKAKISPEESDACEALLAPYTVVPSCPCIEKYDAAVASIQKTDALACTAGDYSLALTVNGDPNSAIFSFYPGSLKLYGKQTCGVDNTSLYEISDVEAEACVAYLDEVIAQNHLICDK